ncbi:hypothetical protein BG004_000715 [Podila humilis]|nr:hypothetical protein BG004_000715 [Podila humilis]
MSGGCKCSSEETVGARTQQSPPGPERRQASGSIPMRGTNTAWRRTEHQTIGLPENLQEPIIGRRQPPSTPRDTTTPDMLHSRKKPASTGLRDNTIETEPKDHRNDSDMLLKKDSRDRLEFESRITGPMFSLSADLAREGQFEEHWYDQAQQASTAVMTSSLHSVRAVSERGLHLAQRSRSSLNRILGAMVENATSTFGSSLPRSITVDTNVAPQHCSTATANYCQTLDGSKPQQRQAITPSALSRSPPNTTLVAPVAQVSMTQSSPPPASRPFSGRATFFVCEEESEDESFEDEVGSGLASKGSSHKPLDDSYNLVNGHSNHRGATSVLPQVQPISHQRSSLHANTPNGQPDMGRRQSLLSHLLKAERMKSSLQRSGTADSDSLNEDGLLNANGSRQSPLLVSNTPSRCLNAESSDGESSQSRVSSAPKLYPSTISPTTHHNQGSQQSPVFHSTDPAYFQQQLHQHLQRHLPQFYNCQTLRHNGMLYQEVHIEHGHGLHTRQQQLHQPPTKAMSGLTRTKKSMFKNLDELAMMAASTTTTLSSGSPSKVHVDVWCSPLLVSDNCHPQSPQSRYHSPPRRYSHVPMSLKV